ncbi:MAG: hypothetical protein ACLUN5_13940 [Oscillospiraceae bacterium]
MHVHLREPGFSYKETIATGTQAGARGGYTAICPMPNLKPVPDSVEHLQPELDAIRKDSVIHLPLRCHHGRRKRRSAGRLRRDSSLCHRFL